MKKMTLVTAAGMALLLAAAGPAPAQDSGTRLTVTLDAPAIACHDDGNGADVAIPYLVTSTGSADSAVLTATLNGQASPLGVIASGSVTGGGGWVFSGRTKTAEGTYTASLPNGSYTLAICATQSGAQGREPKQACSIVTSFAIDCTSDDPCANTEAFGNVVGNPSLCNGNEPAIPIHWKGNFGDGATITIEGPNGFELVGDMSRSGESCVWHHLWKTEGGNHGGAEGTYTFTVEGWNGNTDEFATTLKKCGGGNPND